MKKILSILLSVAMVLSSVSMVVFAVDGPQSENLLPAEISTFDEGGVTSHASLAYLNEGHMYNKAVADGALRINYYGYASNYTTPMWLLGSYIKAYATNNTASSYLVEVSMDVKGSINSANLAVRRAGDASDNTFVNLQSATFNADTYTTVSGSFTLTSAEALATADTWYALCLKDISRPSALAAICFDNVTIKITAVGIATPEPTPEPTPVPQAIGVLPVEISTFENGVTSHASLAYLNEGHMYNKAVADGALRINYQSYAVNYTTPMWLLGAYIRDYATQNSSTKYLVEVSMDVKGSINSANLAIRYAGSADSNAFVNLASATFNADEYTTVSGSFTLTSAEALAAEDAWYALCLKDISRPGALAAIYFDNIAVNIKTVTEVTPEPTPEPTPVPTPEPQPIGLLPVEISTFENGVTSHASLTYLNEGHMYNKSITDGALRVNYYGYATNYTTPMWLLGSYIKNYATQNSSTKYLVEVSMEVKGSINSANLAIRYAGSADSNAFVNLASATFNADEYTTVSGSFTLTSAEALAAADAWYALCLKDISRPSELAAIYFDNIAVNVTPIQSNAIEGATLDIGSTLTINYYADLDDEHKDAVLKVTRNDATVELNGVYDEEYGMYKFAYTGINPQCMVDNVSASLVFNGEVISEKAEYSVKNYFKNIKASDATKLGITEAQYNALITLANDTLIYGREAQKHMNYNLTELATDNLTWITEDATTLATPNELFKSVTNTDANNKVASATLNISNTVKVLYRVKLANKNLTVKVNGVEAELVATNNADEYLVYSDALKATDFNKAYTITITDGLNEISKVVYSVNDYIAYIAAKGETSSLYNVVKALNNYGISAVAFKNA